MDSNKTYNLDDVQEYFTFKVKGHTYQFRHMNSEETGKLRELALKAKNNPEDTKIAKENEDYLFSFITKVDGDSPEFIDIQKQMIAPQWKRFREMLYTEFGIDNEQL